MGQVSHKENLPVAVHATRVAIGVAALVGIFYYLDITFAVSKLFDLVTNDIVMIGVCGVSFCVFWILMTKWFFEPYIELFEAREKATVGAEADFQAKEEEANRVMEKYEELVLQARTQAMKKKLAILADSKQKAQKIIEEAQGQAQQMLAEARKQISEEKSSLSNVAKQEAETLASAVVSKILV